MKILYVISSYPNANNYDGSYGGAAEATSHISKILKARGHDVTVFSTDTLDKNNRITGFNNPSIQNGVNVYRFKNLSNKLAFRNLPFAPSIQLALERMIKDFDIIHVNDYRSFQALAAYRSAKKNNIPMILQPHGSIIQMGKLCQKKIFDSLFGTKMIRGSDKLIVSSKFELEKCISLYPWIDLSKIHIIENGIDLEKFHPSQSNLFRNEYSISKDKMILTFLGRIHPIKGLDLLINAFSIVCHKEKNAILIIAGPDGGGRSQLMQIINTLNMHDKVIFTGPLSQVKKNELLSDSDIFILPSLYDSFGIVAIEAMASGVPILISNSCGCSELIRDAGAGVIFSSGNVHELSHKLFTLMRNKNELRNMGARGGAYAEQYLDWNKVVNKYEIVYDSIRLQN